MNILISQNYFFCRISVNNIPKSIDIKTLYTIIESACGSRPFMIHSKAAKEKTRIIEDGMARVALPVSCADTLYSLKVSNYYVLQCTSTYNFICEKTIDKKKKAKTH